MLVGGQHGDGRIRIAVLDVHGAQAYRRAGILAERLDDEVLDRHLRRALAQRLDLIAPGDHEDPFGRQQRLEPLTEISNMVRSRPGATSAWGESCD